MFSAFKEKCTERCDKDELPAGCDLCADMYKCVTAGEDSADAAGYVTGKTCWEDNVPKDKEDETKELIK